MTLKKSFVPALIVLTLLNIPPAKAEDAKAPNVDENQVIAQAGDFKMTLKELNDMIRQYPPQFRNAFSTYERRRNLVERILESKVFALLAEKEGLDKDPEIRKQLQNAREQILNYAYHRKLSQSSNVSDEEARAYYDTHPNEFTTPEQVKARHILVAEEEEAKRLRARLVEGAEKFETLAMEKSIDRATSSRGGDLGWVSRGLRGEDFDKVAFTIEPGTVSEVFKTPMGYHILKVEEKRPASPREFEQEKSGIIRRLKANKEKDAIDVSRKETWSAVNAWINDEALKAATPSTEPEPEAAPAAPGTIAPFSPDAVGTPAGGEPRNRRGFFSSDGASAPIPFESKKPKEK